MEKNLDLGTLETCLASFTSRWDSDQSVTVGLDCSDNDSFYVCQVITRHPTFGGPLFDKIRQAVKDEFGTFHTPGDYFVGYVSLASGKYGYEISVSVHRKNKEKIS